MGWPVSVLETDAATTWRLVESRGDETARV